MVGEVLVLDQRLVVSALCLRVFHSSVYCCYLHGCYILCAYSGVIASTACQPSGVCIGSVFLRDVAFALHCIALRSHVYILLRESGEAMNVMSWADVCILD